MNPMQLGVGSSQLLTCGINETLDFKNVFHFQKVGSFVNPAFVIDNIGCLLWLPEPLSICNYTDVRVGQRVSMNG
jgi:hypothetical protein